MSETLQLVAVGLIFVLAAGYLWRRWRNPRRACDACPVDEPPQKLLKIGRKPGSEG
jgi:LPXTG-motif cell wall-anchored protein